MSPHRRTKLPIAGEPEPGPSICRECKWCRPCMPFFADWALAKCCRPGTRYLSRNYQTGRIATVVPDAYCDQVNPDGSCADFEPYKPLIGGMF